MPAKEITPEAVERVRQNRPRRRRFADNPVISIRADGRCTVSVQIPSIGRLLQHDTKVILTSGPYGPYGFYTDARTINNVTEWQEKHKSFIFLRDMLDCSIALDYNFAERRVYTNLGLAEFNAKNARHRVSINTLAAACVRAITAISFYAESDVICAVPPSPDKDWDLPTEIAQLVSEKTGKPDISATVSFAAIKKSIKATSLREKWTTLKAAKLSAGKPANGKEIILLDDKYQSGMTAQFVASRLYKAGAEEVNGLFCIKTWRDTDNQ